ncbi:MAG: AI-2E family transporter, partial [Cyclobacteriaceae bacterium]|nr:AI-2E family transporter [Cyclobacteriaceae bacterium]
MTLFKKPIIFVILALAVFIFISWFFSSIFIYLVISIILSTILRPLTNYLSIQQFFNVRMPRALAVFISFLTLILLLSAFVTLFLPLISDQIHIFTSMEMEQVVAKLEAPLEAFESFILKYQLGDFEKGFLALSIKEGMKNLIKGVEVTSIVENVISLT